ncbi:hypothetical protein INP28_14890, partial [Staphylococcus aureus]|nr:hypothetical protein [Staphylococcus aureus]
MSEVLDFYQQQAQAGFSIIPWLAELQGKGLRDLKRQGFPTRHHEDWKYTQVDNLLQRRFVVQKQKEEILPEDAWASLLL